ncbi:MAG: ABC transporter ATP-binding protein [Candidatus Paceibacterota bacterium]
MKEERNFTFSDALFGLRKIISYVAGFRREFIILCSLAFISAVVDPLTSYFFSRIIYGVTNPGLFFGSIPYAIGFFVIWFIFALAAILIERKAQLRGRIVDEKARIEFFSKTNDFILHLPISFHKTKKSGEIWDKVFRAGNAINDLFSQAIVPIAPQLLSIVIMLTISFFVNWIFGLIFLVGVTVFLIAFKSFAIPNAHLQRKMQETYSVARGHATDAISNIRAVKDFTAEDYEHAKNVDLYREKGLAGWINYITHVIRTSLVQRMIVFTTRGVTLLFSLILILKNQMNLADMVLLNAYVGSIFSPLQQLAGSWRMIQNGVIAVEDVDEILEEKPENYAPNKDFNKTEIVGEVVFENVSFGYQEGQNTLEDVSFVVKPGEVVALVGESGVGKSTLMDLISAFYFPTSGSVKIDGLDTRMFPLSFLRSHIAVVPQETVLFNDTIFNNLRYGNFEATEHEVKDAARKAHCYDFIEKFPEKWESKVGERGLKLSVGQKQRISIARAILRNPRILILDEPTSALDAGTEKIITESLEELMTGRTTFIIAHRLSTVRRANMILVFKNGRIVERGTHEELLGKKKGEYRRLHDLQIGLHA